MSDILSQTEIDALLVALRNGELKAEDIRDSTEAGRVRTYDFRRAMRFSKDHIRNITRIHEHFARLLSTNLSGQLRTMVQLQVESVDQVPYDEYIRSVPNLTILQVLEYAPLEGKVAFEIHPQIVFAMIDRLMGGSIKGPYKERELTEIEAALLGRVLGPIPTFLRETWAHVVELEPRVISTENNPQFLQLATPNETVLVITLHAKLGSASGLLNICIPHVTVEPIMSKLSTQHWMDNEKSKTNRVKKDTIDSHLQQVSVDVAVRLGDAELTFAELLDITVEDIIPLGISIQEPATVLVNGVPTFKGSLGRSRDHFAVKVQTTLEGGAFHGARNEAVSGGN